MPRVNFAPCSVPGCDRIHAAHGRCSLHYQRALASGELVRRKPMTEEERFWSKVSPEPNTGCWLWMAGTRHGGYGTFCRADWSSEGAHRVSWEYANGKIPPGREHFICHRCDTPLCVNPAHLFLGTALDNERDKIAKGRKRYVVPGLFGERSSSATIAWADAVAIREFVAEGATQVEAARRWSLSKSQVGNIVHGRQWRDAGGSAPVVGVYRPPELALDLVGGGR
jgi:hypothetical protein